MEIKEWHRCCKITNMGGMGADLIGGIWGDSPEKSKSELNSKGLVGVIQLGKKKRCDAVWLRREPFSWQRSSDGQDPAAGGRMARCLLWESLVLQGEKWKMSARNNIIITICTDHCVLHIVFQCFTNNCICHTDFMREVIWSTLTHVEEGRLSDPRSVNTRIHPDESDNLHCSPLPLGDRRSLTRKWCPLEK